MRLARVVATGAWTASAVVGCGWLVAGAHAAESPPDRGFAFAPRALSAPVYSSRPPSADPAVQQHVVLGADRSETFVETWLPAPKNGREPPARVPVVLNNTPYANVLIDQLFGEQARHEKAARFYTQRGYAYARAHARGTGKAGGCLDQTGPTQIDDTARVIEYLGRDAPFSDGNVGMFGGSYDAETQISAAGLGDPAKTQYLKAIIPIASVLGQYEYVAYDGVPSLARNNATDVFYLLNSLAPDNQGGVSQLPERPWCQPEQFLDGLDFSGNLTPFWAAREYRPGVPKIRAATLTVHGLADWNVRPVALAGYNDRFARGVPHKAILGIWGHEAPSDGTLIPQWARADWEDTQLAWFDRWLKRLPTGVERWPDVQVQDTTGQWRAEPDFPTTGGPAAHLALDAGGDLGVTRPSGVTSFDQMSALNYASTSVFTYEPVPLGAPEAAKVVFDPVEPQPGIAMFTTRPLAGPLHLTGHPVLDLWVRLSEPDAHIAVLVRALDKSGTPVPHSFNFGLRSARHLDPIHNGRFTQASDKDPPVGEPVLVPVRLHPTSMTVPTGGRLEITVAGSVEGFERSGSNADVEILHDCAHPSRLKFLLPRHDGRLINVRENDERDKPMASAFEAPGPQDADGLATAAVCGRLPDRDDILGPWRPDQDDAARPRLRGSLERNPRTRKLAVTIAVSRAPAKQVRARLLRGRRVVARTFAIDLDRGRRARLSLGRKSRRGQYRLVLTARTEAGAAVRKTRRVRFGARR